VKQFLFVGGMDYEFKGVDFRLFCNSRLKRKVAENTAKSDLRFTIMDVRSGEVVVTDVTFPGGKKTEATTRQTPFRALARSDFDTFSSNGETHHRFKEGRTDTMSVTDVYAAVQNIGAGAPGTLQELSFFSHGWMGGPILVNSFDDRTARVTLPPILGGGLLDFTVPSTTRDPDDKDPRSHFDFIPPTMDAIALGLFRDAFAADGVVWLWGCAFPRLLHQILHKIERNSVYAESGLPNDTKFTITNLSTDEADLMERHLSPIIGAFPDKLRIELEFKFIKHFFCRMTAASYSHHIARNSGRPTFAAVLGTYSDYDTGKLPLMHVELAFKRHFRFYHNYLGFDFDPEGRNYGAHDPAFTCTAPVP
jgi:hypothetical protein